MEKTEKVLMIASEASHFRNFHIPYIKYLIEKGIKVYTASRGGFSFEDAVHINIPFKKKIYSPANFKVLVKLVNLIKKNNFDAVYTNSSLAGFVGRMAVILSGKKQIKTVHICHGYLFNDDGRKRSRLMLLCEKSVSKRTDILAVMNGEDLKIAKKYSLGKRIVFINGMGFDCGKFPSLSENMIIEWKKAYNIDKNEYLFLCVGEFSQRKNQQTIIKACSLIKDENFRIIFAGDGELMDYCKKLSEELNVSDKTLFLGHTQNVNLLYRSCNCLISASRFEGLPFNVMEALYCGESIIVSDVKGNYDLAAEHGGGLYRFSDENALAKLMTEKILNFKNRKNSINSIGETREASLNKKYYIENVFDENLKLLDMKIDEKQPDYPKYAEFEKINNC